MCCPEVLHMQADALVPDALPGFPKDTTCLVTVSMLMTVISRRHAASLVLAIILRLHTN
jgi:hypothetical protein